MGSLANSAVSSMACDEAALASLELQNIVRRIVDAGHDSRTLEEQGINWSIGTARRCDSGVKSGSNKHRCDLWFTVLTESPLNPQVLNVKFSVNEAGRKNANKCGAEVFSVLVVCKKEHLAFHHHQSSFRKQLEAVYAEVTSEPRGDGDDKKTG